MVLPTVPNETHSMTPEQREAWYEMRRGCWQMAKAIDKLLEACKPPKHDKNTRKSETL